jgi:hypothetical protein
MARVWIIACCALAVVAVLGVLLLTGQSQAQEGELKLPSGLVVKAHEILWEDHPDLDEIWIVARFIAPDIARSASKITFEDVDGDFIWMCQEVVAPLAKTLGGADQAIVQILDQIVPRGQTNASATQFMSAFSVKTGDCIWE